MKDFLGNTLHVGDTVAYEEYDGNLKAGVIRRIFVPYKEEYEVCDVGNDDIHSEELYTEQVVRVQKRSKRFEEAQANIHNATIFYALTSGIIEDCEAVLNHTPQLDSSLRIGIESIIHDMQWRVDKASSEIKKCKDILKEEEDDKNNI